MAITRKPKTNKNTSGINEKQISQLINKGGSVAASDNDSDKQVLVRLPKDLLEQVDELAKGRRIRTPRNTWIVEALYEKVEREGTA